jgi:hypothetical protein
MRENMKMDKYPLEGVIEMLSGLLAGFVVGTLLPYQWWVLGLWAFIIPFTIFRVVRNRNID